MCRGPLNVELIAARPSCFSLYRQGATRSTGFASPVHPTHPFLTEFTSKDFLHVSCLTRNPIWRSPSSILSIHSLLVSGRFCGRMRPVLRHFMGAARQRLNLHAVKMIHRQASLTHGI